MVFCAYCGQSFKRKEHLERHLPTHTNVKPYKCDSCQLSFARRDLLQKHHSTYHEAPVNQQGSNGEMLVNQRTPIACMNCATAKAGCDKKVPCSRCVDKNLSCAPRFARRSKGIARSSTSPAIPTVSNYQPVPHQIENSNAPLRNGSDSGIDMQMDGEALLKEENRNDPNLLLWANSNDQCSDLSQSSHFSPRSLDSLSNQHANFDGSTKFSGGSGGFDNQPFDIDHLNLWNNCAMDLDICGSSDLGFLSHGPMLWFPETDLAGNNGMPSPPSTTSASHSRINSISPVWQTQKNIFLSDSTQGFKIGDIEELNLVIATEEAWPFARCNPRIFSGSCPRTAMIHLQALQNCSKLEDAWNSMNDMISPNEQAIGNDHLAIVALETTTRDKIIAFAQSFLLKALMIHQGANRGLPTDGKSAGSATFFTLPPSNVLENLLRSSVRSLTPYYSLIHGTALDPNELMLDNDTSTLLFLFMMAQGASTVPRAEARYLAAGLTETCRISLFDVIEKNVELSADPTVLKSAFLFVLLGAWGGDAWHIKQAMGQRGMYLAMLKHSGLLERQTPVVSDFNGGSDISTKWREWLRREHIYRLVYNWVMIDQELSLFHDTPPIMSITDLQAPLPCGERLWRASNAVEWFEILQETYASSSDETYHSPTYFHKGFSLSHLFQDMLRDELEVKNRKAPAPLLKLLLHPLQSLVFHLGQLLSSFYGMHDYQQGTRPLLTASTLMRLEEVQSTLHKWYDLAMVNHRAEPDCSITNGSLVLYHIIYLNTVAYFPEIERLTRKEGDDSLTWESALRSRQFIYQPEKAIFHCGQIFRIVKAMPATGRPPWWSAALYRASLIVWMDSNSRYYAGESLGSGPLLAINSSLPDDPAIKAYLNSGFGVPSFQLPDGSLVNLDKPDEVLRQCILLLDDGVSTRFSDGIRRKLQTLRKNWKFDAI